MIKNQQKYKGVVLGSIGLIILVFAAFIYNQITSPTSIHESESYQQTQSMDSSLNSVPFANTATGDEIVHTKDYEQFWIWTPPEDDTKLSQAHTLYILQGEIRPSNIPYYRPNTNENADHAALATLTPQGLGVRSLSDKKIWLVYRATSQEWSDEVMAQLIERLEKWQRAGNHVMGLQIDYDAPTYQLDKYAQLLRHVRQQLPAHYQLSVTGLLDWSNQAEDPQFMQLSDAVDELVIQTYQGTTTLTNYSRYLKKLENLPFDFKVGIVEGGQWQGAAFLENNPYFKGYVVFLR
ncbi:DUF3142 domain-containing protein [Psychrobacter sp. APC 3350]|uniref:DUF3142 domain-containing protein n=1 Tax=Psychrobacter sp. APC 3350 TaxID=3035195 RepID=UPI0025B5DA00|nr:DUF3142 domain-containing protein [Psychrobacter sp. APC 3350]MDN3452079.1 DUF3142 domain-containing protein [Psychrobacter sp. APC 3350]